MQQNAPRYKRRSPSQRSCSTPVTREDTYVPKKIIAIIDNVAHDIAGQLTLHQHDTTAFRYFNDAMTHPDSYIGKHKEDFDLVQLGILDDDLTIIAQKEIMLTGKHWAEMQSSFEEAK